VAARYPSFPIVLEAYRECLRDVFDLPGLVDLARRVRRREIRLVTVDTQAPSPFSASLLFGYVANYLYEGDAPLAERRAQALSVDQRQLRELLGKYGTVSVLECDSAERTRAMYSSILRWATPLSCSLNWTPTPTTRLPSAPAGVTQTTRPATGIRSGSSMSWSRRKISSPSW